jgi:hypothetical protein
MIESIKAQRRAVLEGSKDQAILLPRWMATSGTTPRQTLIKAVKMESR